MKDKILIHVGYPKTGTSYIQDFLLPYLSENKTINYVPFVDVRNAVRRVQYQDPLFFDFPTIRNEILAFFDSKC